VQKSPKKQKATRREQYQSCQIIFDLIFLKKNIVSAKNGAVPILGTITLAKISPNRPQKNSEVFMLAPLEK